MAGSSIGTIIKMTTFGESHGNGVGCVLDGFPAGMRLKESDIQRFLDRRRPGKGEASTKRKEADTVEILSGVFKGVTTGAPIAMLIRNTDQHSRDYEELKNVYRPGHADLTFDAKYGVRDYRGGGRASGRETAARVAAGAVCMKLLKEMGIDVCAFTRSIGETVIEYDRFKRNLITKTATAMPDKEADLEALSAIKQAAKAGDSLGGVVECIIAGLPAGIGDPVFEKLDANLAKALTSIGAVKAFECGAGIFAPLLSGAESNDAFANFDGRILPKTNHAGGILGGMSTGADILVRAHFKPTPSISKTQETVNKNGKSVKLSVKGRHDPVIVPRAVVVVECMCAFTVLDALLLNMSARAENVKRFYALSSS